MTAAEKNLLLRELCAELRASGRKQTAQAVQSVIETLQWNMHNVDAYEEK